MKEAPFDHPMGLMFAIAAYFQAANVHLQIESQSPPRSALGGSSAAAAALIGAFSKLWHQAAATRQLTRPQVVTLAHGLEESVAGVPCGLQDHLAAVYGGVHAWRWPDSIEKPLFRKKMVLPKKMHRNLEKHLLLAYCGKPHASKDINSRWVAQFLGGRFRDDWAEIVDCCRQFVRHLANGNYRRAAALMNKETAIRQKMTPEVLDGIGIQLAESAGSCNCGARFTGAGGGGCVWALGEIKHIDRLRPIWEEILSSENDARLLNINIDSFGLIVR
jgi:D-glycero-alpha-D-manno-heptose-7-phosphate kinase